MSRCYYYSCRPVRHCRGRGKVELEEGPVTDCSEPLPYMWCRMRRTCRGRAGMRRRAPAAAAALLATCGATLLLVWLAGYGSGGGDTLPVPRPPPSAPGVMLWVVLGVGGAPGGEVCGRIAVRYPGWTVLVYRTDQPDQNRASLTAYQRVPEGNGASRS